MNIKSGRKHRNGCMCGRWSYNDSINAAELLECLYGTSDEEPALTLNAVIPNEVFPLAGTD